MKASHHLLVNLARPTVGFGDRLEFFTSIDIIHTRQERPSSTQSGPSQYARDQKPIRVKMFFGIPIERDAPLIHDIGDNAHISAHRTIYEASGSSVKIHHVVPRHRHISHIRMGKADPNPYPAVEDYAFG